MDPFYRIRFDDGSHFDYSSDPAAMRAQIARISPADVAGYERFVQEAELCYRLGFEKLGSIAYDTVGDLLRASPNLVRMRGWRSLYKLVATHMQHPKLRIAFSLQSLLIGGNPFNVTSIYSLINALERRCGVHWAMGGTGALVQGLVGLLRERGVAVRCNAEVRRIVVEGGRATGVELADGERLGAEVVVSNADTAWTYRHLIERQHRPLLDRQAHRTQEVFDEPVRLVLRHQAPVPRGAAPHHGARAALRRPAEGHLRSATTLSRRFQPVPAPPQRHRSRHGTRRPRRLLRAVAGAAPGQRHRLGRDGRDATAGASSSGCTTRCCPGFAEHVVTSRVTTPQDFHDRLLSYKGAAFGMEPLLQQSAYFRPHNRSEDVRGLYLVGAGTHPGAGVPGVLMSAKALDTVMPRMPEHLA